MWGLDFFDNVLTFLKNYYLYITSGLILFTGLYYYIRYDLKELSSIEKSIKKINLELMTLVSLKIDNIHKINNIFDSYPSSVMKRVWQEYLYDFTNVFDEKKCPDIKEYFNITNVITIPTSRKKTEGVPRLLTAVGVLGAFCGLALALFFTDIKPADFEQNIGQLTKDAALSLVTVITAIFISILFQILDKKIYHKTIEGLFKFHRLIERKIPVVNNKRSSCLLLYEQENFRVSINHTIDSIPKKFNKFASEKLVPAMNNSYMESIEKHISPTIREMGQMLDNMLKEILNNQKESAENMTELFMKSLNDAVGSQFTALKENIKSLMESLKKSNDYIESMLQHMSTGLKEQKEVNTSTHALLKEMTKQSKEITSAGGKLFVSLETIGEFVEKSLSIINSNNDVMEKLNTLNEKSINDNKEYLENMNEQVNRLNDTLNYGMERIFGQFNEMLESTIGEMDTTMTDTVEKLNDNFKIVLSQIDEHVRNLTLYANEINTDVRELNENLSESVEEFGVRIHTGINNTFEDFDEGLSEISSRLCSVINEIRDSVEDLPGVIMSLKYEMSRRRQ